LPFKPKRPGGRPLRPRRPRPSGSPRGARTPACRVPTPGDSWSRAHGTIGPTRSYPL
jgi:hypothetical protein